MHDKPIVELIKATEMLCVEYTGNIGNVKYYHLRMSNSALAYIACPEFLFEFFIHHIVKNCFTCYARN